MAMASTTQSSPIGNVKTERDILSPWNNMVSNNLSLLSSASTKLASPTVFLENVLRPLFMERTTSHKTIAGINSALPIPMVWPGVGFADLFLPFFIMNRMRFTFVMRNMPRSEAVGIPDAFPSAVFADYVLRFLRVMLGEPLTSRVVFKSLVPRNTPTGICGANSITHFLNLFRRMFPSCLSFGWHDESPYKNRVNSAKIFRSAINNISSILSRCQADNAEPAGEIAKGSPGVCDGQR